MSAMRPPMAAGPIGRAESPLKVSESTVPSCAARRTDRDAMSRAKANRRRRFDMFWPRRTRAAACKVDRATQYNDSETRSDQRAGTRVSIPARHTYNILGQTTNSPKRLLLRLFRLGCGCRGHCGHLEHGVIHGYVELDLRERELFFFRAALDAVFDGEGEHQSIDVLVVAHHGLNFAFGTAHRTFDFFLDFQEGISVQVHGDDVSILERDLQLV